MVKVSEALAPVANPPANALRESSPRSSRETASQLAYIWARMLERYGQPWLSVHGDEPSPLAVEEWGDALDGCTDDDVRRAFTADAKRASDWPPSSAVFRAMAIARPLAGRATYTATGHAGLSRDERQRAHRAAQVALQGIAAHLGIDVPNFNEVTHENKK